VYSDISITFCLGADGQKAGLVSESEARSNAKCVATDVDFPVSGVQQAEEEDAVQMAGGELDTAHSVQMNDHLAVACCVVPEIELLLQLRKRFR